LIWSAMCSRAMSTSTRCAVSGQFFSIPFTVRLAVVHSGFPTSMQ
jgi:hypothetical protein